jgi:DNA-binding NarL/FixJ family response regulator
VLAAVLHLRPSLPVLMTSGHDEAYVRERIGHAPIAGFLAKPWQPEDLETMVRSVLELPLT